MYSKSSTKRTNLIELIDRWGFRAENALKLQGYARSLHRLDENACNYGLTDRQEKRGDRLRDEITAIASVHGIYAYHQGDPRGWPILLDTEPIADNDTYRPFRVCPY
jgi:hypothetical protein